MTRAEREFLEMVIEPDGWVGALALRRSLSDETYDVRRKALQEGWIKRSTFRGLAGFAVTEAGRKAFAEPA